MENKANWTERMNNIVNTCQEELQRATKIGRKMLLATKKSSSLHESYLQLGFLVAKAIEDKTLKWDNSEALKLVKKIQTYKNDLESMEEEVTNIKFSPTDPKQPKKTPSKTP